MRESISISLPENVKAELDRFTQAEGITRSDLIRQALQEYLLIRKFRTLRSSMMLQAQDQSIFTDEDVFERIS